MKGKNTKKLGTEDLFTTEISVKDIVWDHDADYEAQARCYGFTLGPIARDFMKRYKRLHNGYINGPMTYTQYQKAIKDLEKDICRYAEKIR